MTATTFSGEDLAHLLALVRGADSVELKLTIPDSHHRSTVAALGMDPLDAELRQIVFFDTPDLALDGHGVVVRARRIQGKGCDAIVKLRPVVPEQLPAELRREPEFRVEVDALPGGFVCSAALKSRPASDRVKEVLAGTRPAHKLFSRRQRDLVASYAPLGLDLDDLVVLGPILVLKLRFTPSELRRRLAAELWLYPDGSRVLELSTRCATGEAFQAAAELRGFLAGRGIALANGQQTKTRKALEYFAARVAQDRA
jgi:hypothetical protein